MTKVPLAKSIGLPSPYPFWFFGKGTGMKLGSIDLKKKTLTISWGAKLTISFDEQQTKNAKGVWWKINWEIEGSVNVKANTSLDNDELMGAFALRPYFDIHSSWGDWALERYGANSISIGSYIRSGDFLNIPGPGIGRGADANISLLLRENMRAAVLLLVLEAEAATKGFSRIKTPPLKELLPEKTLKLLEKYPNTESLFENSD